MANYLIPVLLHNASEQHYTTLHTALEGIGVERTITGSDGKVYQLPTGTYYVTRNSTLDAVRQAVATAAASTGCANAVVMGQTTTVGWSGLALA